MKRKTLVIAPGRKTRGGITSVILAYEQTSIWKKWNCVWIETYIDKSAVHKIYYFFSGMIKYLLCINYADIVHIHISEPTSAFRKSFFFNIAIFLKKKIVIHLHAFSSESTIYGKRKKLYEKMFTKSNYVIVLSPFWKNELSNAYGVQRVQTIVLFNPSTKKMDMNTPKCEKEKILLFAGTLNARKGYQDLIKSFEKIHLDFPEWKLVLAGNGEKSVGEELVQQLNLVEKVIFTGWLDGLEMDELFRKSTIFCLPSYYEGLPMSILDAWAYELPVIATSLDGFSTILKDGINCLLYKPGDIETLSEKIKVLFGDEALCKTLINNSNLLVNTTFSIGNISKELDSIYTSLFSNEKLNKLFPDA